MRRLVALFAMPLAVVPLALAVPALLHRIDPGAPDAGAVARGRLPAPAVTAPVAVATASSKAHPRAVPVLVYHGVALRGQAQDRWSVSRAQLARQLDALRRAGYRTVDAATYARFVRGAPVRLPRRPLLITFDDGRLDSFRGSDAILARTGMRATMFAIAQRLDDGSPGYLRSAELRRMHASGRWDVGLHAGRGHRLVPAAGGGGERPFYATRTPGESLAGWRARVTVDLATAARELAASVPGARTDLFAVPYSDYGQTPGGDRRIVRELRRAWTSRFAATFVQRDDPAFSTAHEPGFVARYEVGRATSAEELLAWLATGASRVPAAGRGD